MPSGLQAGADRLKRTRLAGFVRRNPLYYGRAQRQLAALQTASLEERRLWTQERLHAVLVAAKRTPYGAAIGATLDIDSWPLLEKEKLRGNVAAFIASRDWFAAPAATGGTTGIPLQLFRSMKSVAVEQVYIDAVMRQLGADPYRAKVAVLRGDNIKDPSDLRPPYWTYTQGGQRLVMSSNMLAPQTINDYVKTLTEFQPDVLYAYPTSLESLCRLLHQSDRRLRIPYVITSSEVLKRAAWNLAEETLGCRLADYYGQAERLAFACAFAPREYRFQPGYGHVELVPFETGTDPGAQSGQLYEIVGTPLWNLHMPLVRYKTGVLIRLPTEWGERERDEVAHGLRSFPGVLGREQEILVCPLGIRLTGIDHIPRDVANVLRIQVIQESLQDVRILVLPAPQFSPEDAEHLLQNARAKIPDTMSVQIEVAETLERTPRGKTPLVIHRPPVQDMLRKNGFEPSVTHAARNSPEPNADCGTASP